MRACLYACFFVGMVCWWIFLEADGTKIVLLLPFVPPIPFDEVTNFTYIRSDIFSISVLFVGPYSCLSLNTFDFFPKVHLSVHTCVWSLQCTSLFPTHPFSSVSSLLSFPCR